MVHIRETHDDVNPTHDGVVVDNRHTADGSCASTGPNQAAYRRNSDARDGHDRYSGGGNGTHLLHTGGPTPETKGKKENKLATGGGRDKCSRLQRPDVRSYGRN